MTYVAEVGDDATMTLTDKSTWRTYVGFVSIPEEICASGDGDHKKAVAPDRAKQRGPSSS